MDSPTDQKIAGVLSVLILSNMAYAPVDLLASVTSGSVGNSSTISPLPSTDAWTLRVKRPIVIKLWSALAFYFERLIGVPSRRCARKDAASS